MKVICRTLPENDPHYQATAPRRTAWQHRRFMTVLFLLGVLPVLAPSSLAQAPTPLNFGNNFFVTGDYLVAGANGMTSKFTTVNGTSYALGTISVPDSNPGIQGVKQVPKGAQIVAALLYWQNCRKGGSDNGRCRLWPERIFQARIQRWPSRTRICDFRNEPDLARQYHCFLEFWRMLWRLQPGSYCEPTAPMWPVACQSIPTAIQ